MSAMKKALQVPKNEKNKLKPIRLTWAASLTLTQARCSQSGGNMSLTSQFVVCAFVAGMIIKRKSGEIPCPLAVEAFAAHLSYICKYDDKYSKYVQHFTKQSFDSR